MSTDSSGRVRASNGRFVGSAPRVAAKGTTLDDVVAQARALAGDEWHTIRSWPLESGLVFLADKLKG